MAETKTTKKRAKKTKTTTKKNGASDTTVKETKSEKFSRLGTARLSKARTALRRLTACFGPGYESTEEQQKKVIAALKVEIDALQSAMAGKKASDVEDIQL